MMKVASGEKSQPSRFGFAASLKFSKKAAERNKVKRWMREAVRAKLKDIQPGKEVVFLINPKAPKSELSLQTIQKNIENLLKQAKIL